MWVFDEGAVDGLGEAGADISDDELGRVARPGHPDDIATIIYTPGTTGRPKGCQLTHRNLRFESDNVVGSMPDLFDAHGPRCCSCPWPTSSAV